MMEYVIITILCIGLISLGFVVRNLLIKVEKYEEDILLKDEYIEKFKRSVEESYNRIKEMDSRGAFEADDEVGYFFKTLKDVIITLDAYFKNYIKEENN